MALFDSHLHIARLPEPLEVARELHERGYRYRAVACEPWEWKALQELWEKASAEGWLDGCGLSFGIHPEIVGEIQEQDLRDLEELLKKFLDAQVGEAGLDKRYAGYEPGGAQEAAFRRQAKLALELGRDLQIHCVGDYGRIVNILKEVGMPRPIFHRFGGDAGIVKAGKPLGALFSIHSDSLRKKATREALGLIPQANLLFETDADETFIASCGSNGTIPQACTPRQIANALVEQLNQVQNSL